MANLNSSVPCRPVELMDLTSDHLELICCFLPVWAIGAFAPCCKASRAIANSQAVWRAQFAALAEEHPNLDNHFSKLSSDIVAATSSARSCYLTACSQLHVWQYEHAVLSWTAADYSSLKELGLVVKPGTADAQFIPFEPIQTPIKAKAALELLRCVGKQKPDPNQLRGTNDKYRRVAFILNDESLHCSLRNLEAQISRIRKRSALFIGKFLIDEWPKRKFGAVDGSMASAPASSSALVLVVRSGAATKSERALERALMREQRAHALTKAQLSAASQTAATQADELEQIVQQNTRIPQLEKLIARLEGQLKERPSEADHQILHADLRRAERTVRGLIRQSEDAGAKADRVAAALRRERNAALAAVTEKEASCMALKKKGEAAAQLGLDAMRRAEMTRSGAAAVAARKRAEIAEEKVAALEDAAKELEKEMRAGKGRAAAEQAELQSACRAATSQAQSARHIADELRLLVAAGAADVAALQQDLSKQFVEMGALKEGFVAEKAKAVAAAKAGCAVDAAKIELNTKERMVRDAVLNPSELCPHSTDIVNARMKAFERGELFRPQPISVDKHGLITHRGKARSFMALVDGNKDAEAVGAKQLRNRSANLNAAVNHLAAGEAHAATLMADHAKANPKLYKMIGVKMQRKLSVEETAAFCNETSGLLGAAMRRHLKSCGVQLASKADIQSYFKESWEECETGKVTVPDPKRRGRVMTGGWLRVNNLLAVIQRSLTRFAEKGELAWPSNISGNECWFQLIIDKGSSATKIIVKYNCISNPESVRNVSLVGMLDKVKDTYEMMSIFKPLFNQFNNINRCGVCVWTPWQQLLPAGFSAANANQQPIPDYANNTKSASAAEEPALQTTFAPPDRNTAPFVPDCKTCFKFGTKCPSKQRRAFVSNGDGDVDMQMNFGDGPGLLSNTWCADCAECASNKGGQLDALRRQWSEVRHRGGAWRRLRGMLGGDWLSIAVPLGLGGPKNKQFCMVCLASLHDTNAAGVPHLPSMPLYSSYSDPRAPHIAQPQLRAGTASMELQADTYARAVTEHATGDLSRKPEPANFDSCVEAPLVWAAGHLLDLISCTPLHFMLGITVDLINCLEWELKVFDWECRRQPADPKLAQELQQAANEAADLRAEVERWEDLLAHHKSSLEVIEGSTGAAEAIARGKKPLKRTRGYTPLPLEAEYRLHLAKVKEGESQLERLGVSIDALKRKAVRVSAEDPGPFSLAFFDAMNAFDFQRQAYHSGALVGNDCQKVLQPVVAAALTDLLRPRAVVCDDGEGCERTKILGSNERADDYLALLTDFGLLTSLFMRKSPLCAHHIALFNRTVESFAVRYACMFPCKEPPPKVHAMCYHMVQQMLRLGGTGFLSESVVEAMHVVDNRMVSRYACVKSMEDQLRCRARAIWQLNNPNTANIRKADHDNAARKRERHAMAHRMRRSAELAVPPSL